jgi:2,5-diketo-D-gluconate reductase A
MPEPVTSRLVELPGGVAMPLLGLGTAKLLGPECEDLVRFACEQGYRLYDTATAYGNEREVGAGVRAAGVPRDELFLTTKLPPDRAGRERETLEESLAALGVDYVDLWLVHWPPSDLPGVATWRELERARAEGLARAVGVSNYSLAQIDVLIRETGVTPAVNQVRWNPMRHDPGFLEALRQRGVVLQGYSPLKDGVLDSPVVRELAVRHSVAPAQVVLRWHVQHGVVVIPRSSRRERIAVNADLDGFELTTDDMATLDSLAQ